MNNSILFNCAGEIAAQAAAETLTRHSLRVVRSFDLHSAMSAHMDCECPHHGTAHCTCQFVVLLVYGENGAPVVVTAHSRDVLAQVQLIHDANSRPDPRLTEQVMAALFEAALTVQAVVLHPVEAPADAQRDT